MIEAGNPMVYAVGPVVADNCGLSIFILRQNQTIFRFAMIRNRDLQVSLGRDCRRQCDLKLSILMEEGNWLTVQGHGVGLKLAEIEINKSQRFQRDDINVGLCLCDLGQGIVQCDRNVVVGRTPRIDQTFATKRKSRERGEDDDNDRGEL